MPCSTAIYQSFRGGFLPFPRRLFSIFSSIRHWKYSGCRIMIGRGIIDGAFYQVIRPPIRWWFVNKMRDACSCRHAIFLEIIHENFHRYDDIMSAFSITIISLLAQRLFHLIIGYLFITRWYIDFFCCLFWNLLPGRFLRFTLQWHLLKAFHYHQPWCYSSRWLIVSLLIVADISLSPLLDMDLYQDYDRRWLSSLFDAPRSHTTNYRYLY